MQRLMGKGRKKISERKDKSDENVRGGNSNVNNKALSFTHTHSYTFIQNIHFHTLFMHTVLTHFHTLSHKTHSDTLSYKTNTDTLSYKTYTDNFKQNTLIHFPTKHIDTLSYKAYTPYKNIHFQTRPLTYTQKKWLHIVYASETMPLKQSATESVPAGVPKRITASLFL